jgi:aminopeptidase N
MQTVPRLIKQFVPDNYQLSLTLDRKNRTFGGIVTIIGELVKDGQLQLHSKDLKIELITFDGKKADFSQDEDHLTITHKDMLLGSHVVIVSFSGVISDAMHGLYPCYFEYKGEKKELLATQFESHHAREVFPCVDEPEAKATYDVTLTTEQDVTVLGNMPVTFQRVENDLLVTAFARTPRMSSYLLAWVVGELHKKTATTKSGVEVNLWATPAQKPESLDFGLDIAVRTIDFFDEYFGVKYPLPKSDHVALPDFSSGAMENWGLITYREVALLADPKTTSVSSKHYIATVIAHELSHQWFGNLVTMAWWNNLWLNESFATLMEYLAIDALEPDWDIWADFSSSESIAALRRDSLEGVQSVQMDVNHPDEISTLFDGAIVYAKGGRLLHMLQTYVGNDAFRSGLKDYFQKHAYGNTEANDLWESLSLASGKDIALFMNVWISQSGYPVLHVSKSGSDITLQQEQFFIGPHKPSDKLWPIPLDSSCSEMPELMSERQITITRHHTTPLLFNVHGSSHFITHYDDELFTQIIADFANLSSLARLQLLNEQTLLARAGIIPSANLIPLLQVYKEESTETVWDLISLAFNELRKFVESDQKAENKLREFAATLAQLQYDRLGWEPTANESESDTKLRSIIISMMLYSERKDIVDKALEYYKDTPLEKLDPELRPLIVGTAVRQDTSGKLVDELLKKYTSTTLSELQQDIASAITSTKNPSIIERLLATIPDTKVIRTQDSIRWYVWLQRNRYGRTVAWQWIRDNWKSWVEKTFDGDKSYDVFPSYIANSLMTSAQLKEYKTFFTPLLTVPSLKRNIEIGIGELQGRVELIERDEKAVQKALLDL